MIGRITGMDNSRLPLIIGALALLALVSLLTSAWCFFRYASDGDTQLAVHRLAAQQQQLLGQMTTSVHRASQRASVADNQALTALSGRFSEQQRDLRVGASQVSRLALPMQAVDDAWEALQPALSEATAAAQDSLAGLPLLAETSASLRRDLARADADVELIESAGHLYQLASSMQKQVRQTGGGRLELGNARGAWLVFEQILVKLEERQLDTSLLSVSSAELLRSIRAQRDNLAAQMSSATLSVAGAADTGLARRQAVDLRAGALGEALDALQNTAASLGSSLSNWWRYGMLGLLLGGLALLTVSIVSITSLRRWQGHDRVRSSRREQSILRLLDEVSEVADGNLDARATVTEDETGALADCFNYAISELRRLVGSIRHSSDRVAQAVLDTGATAQQMADASALQTRQIGRSTHYLNALSDTMRQISRRAGEAAGIAARSRNLAASGQTAVRKTSVGVDRIEVHTEQAVASLSRLRDSSAQIDRVLKMLSQAARETRLLAMNTALRQGHLPAADPIAPASDPLSDAISGSAAPRVNEQIQGLAKALLHATGEMAALLQAIQQDTDRVAQAIEATHHEVREVGALSKHANQCLTDIDGISERMSALVEELDERTTRQTEVAGQIAQNMNEIAEVTQHSAHGLRLSSAALEDLQSLADELRTEVRAFSDVEAPITRHSGDAPSFSANRDATAVVTATDSRVSEQRLDQSFSEAGELDATLDISSGLLRGGVADQRDNEFDKTLVFAPPAGDKERS